MAKQIVLVHGVVGGFKPAVPSKQLMMDFPKKGGILLTRNVREDGTRMTTTVINPESNKDIKTSRDGDYLVQSLLLGEDSLHASEINTLLTSWQSSLKSLPMEEPRGCEDIYGQDASLIFNINEERWQNTPNQGCNATPSSVKPSQAQKETFKKLLLEINTLFDNHFK